MRTLPVRRALYTIFLGLAYIAITLQWLWVLIIGLPPLIESDMFVSFMQPAEPAPVTPKHDVEFSPIIAIIAGAITLVFLVLTIIIFIKLPKTIMGTGEKIMHQSSEAIVPVITHHKKLPPKKRRQLSMRITRFLQLLLLIIPCVVSFFVPPFQTITSQIITTLAIWLAVISMVCLLLSWLLEPKTTSRTRSHASRG